MRLIQLTYNDFDLFDTPFNEKSFEFYCTHREAFRQMLKEQGREFWIRFLLSFRSFHSHYGFIALMSAKTNKRFNETMDWFFIKLHEMFIDGTLSDAKQLFDDIVLVVEKRHLVQNLKSKSCVKDPFYYIETRDAYRRLFGNPTERVSYVRVVIVFPVYELFAGTLISCLKRWIDALETDPSDTSYWIAAPPVLFVPTTSGLSDTPTTPPTADTPTGPSPKKDTPTGPSPRKDRGKIFPRQTFTQESVRADIESLLMKERQQGSGRGPVFVNGWPTNRDPRFTDPFNPLYDPAATRGTDWRQNVNIDTFQCFVEFAAKRVSAATKPTTAAAAAGKTTAATCSPDETKTGKQGSNDGASGKSGKETGKQSSNDGASGKSGKETGKQGSNDGASGRPEVASSNQCYRKALNKKTRESGRNTTVNSEQDLKCMCTEQIGDGVNTQLGQGQQVISTARVALKGGSDVTKMSVLMGGEVSRTVTGTGDSSAAITATTDTCVLYKLKFCAGCAQLETVPHQFKKCKKCKEINCKDIKYYCSRQCQVSDWTARHCQEHRSTAITVVDHTYMSGTLQHGSC